MKWVNRFVFLVDFILTGCGCSAMQQLKQTQNSVILRLLKKPQKFPFSAQTSLCVFLPVQCYERHKHKTETDDRRRQLVSSGETAGPGLFSWHKEGHFCRHVKDKEKFNQFFLSSHGCADHAAAFTQAGLFSPLARPGATKTANILTYF